MKKHFRDMMVYIVLILGACFVVPLLFQKMKEGNKNYANSAIQKNKYESAYKYEEVIHYKNCDAKADYETMATVWVLDQEKEIVQQVKVQFTAESNMGDAYFEVKVPKKYKGKNLNTVFSQLQKVH